jgi:hypothetical protein
MPVKTTWWAIPLWPGELISEENSCPGDALLSDAQSFGNIFCARITTSGFIGVRLTLNQHSTKLPAIVQSSGGAIEGRRRRGFLY